ncbi:hypothetical protein ACROYT_G038919 [Oculina patagonica]
MMTLFADSETAQVAIVTVLSILVMVDVIGNTLVCIIIMRNQDMRTPMNYLLVNLAVADLMVATFFALMHIFIHTFTHPDGVTGTMFCKFLTGGTFGWVGGVSSSFTLVAIATERYYAVIYPHGNKGKLTKSKLKVIIPASWIFSLIINTPVFLSMKLDNTIASCLEKWPEEWMGKAFSMTWFLTFGAFPIMMMIALYSRVVYSLWFKRQHSELSLQQRGVLKIRKRVTLMVVTVSTIFAICWLTDGVIYILSYYSTTNRPNDVTYAVAFTMILFNSAVNPFVYALVNQRFREKMKGMLCRTCRHTNRIHSTSRSDEHEAGSDSNVAHPTQTVE